MVSSFGQFFVYRMIKQFKQHVLPFTITTRKIFTAIISILYYHHKTNFLQIVGILIVFGTVGFDFIREISKKDEEEEQIVQASDNELSEKEKRTDK